MSLRLYHSYVSYDTMVFYSNIMLNPLRNLKDLLLYAIGAYIITKISFPPNQPPPNIPFTFPFHLKDVNDDEHSNTE